MCWLTVLYAVAKRCVRIKTIEFAGFTRCNKKYYTIGWYSLIQIEMYIKSEFKYNLI